MLDFGSILTFTALVQRAAADVAKDLAGNSHDIGIYSGPTSLALCIVIGQILREHC